MPGAFYDPRVATNRRLGRVAVLLLVSGVVLMVVPPLARDGICGLVPCTDQAPDIAVTRTAPDQIAVVVPEDAAPSVRSVRLLEGSARSTGSQQWFIRRDGRDVTEVFPLGAEPEGFRTVTELAAQPTEGSWVVVVGFGCTNASLPFDPGSVTAGRLSSWTGVTDGASFAASATTEEACATSAGTLERVLLVLGALLTVAGAVIGIVVVLRRPVRLEDDPEGPGEPEA